MISLEEAQRRILDRVLRQPGEPVLVGAAQGRYLEEPVVAVRAQPPVNNSAMDGYAVRWDDVRPASGPDGEAVELEVVETLAAGSWPTCSLGSGQAARIMTGAPMPDGGELVVIQERAESIDDGRRVRIDSAGPGPGDNVREAGEDISVGEVVADQGRSLGAADLALLAAQGMTEVLCRRRPRIGILSTGDEVQEPGDDLPEGHIYCGNSRGLAALVTEAGGVPHSLGIARDNAQSLRDAFAAARDCDAVVSIGGVSVGEFDFVKQVLQELGAEQHFWKVAMRPGKPNAFGSVGGVPYFGLPGNPVSCLVSFLQYVRPAILAMQGASECFLPTRTAVLEHAIRSRAKFLFLYRGICRFDEDTGGYRVRTTGPQGSGILRSMALANCLISVPEEVDSLDAGATVRIQLLPSPRSAQFSAGLR